MAEIWDAIVIGGGHNGLTAAGYLGKAGLKTLVLERRAVLGGAAVTEEFHPGYRNSIASYTVSLLRPEVIRDLELKAHGLEFLRYSGTLNYFEDGKTLFYTGDDAHDRAQVARYSNRDWENLHRFHEAVTRVGEVIRALWLKEPPDLGGGLFELLGLLKAGNEVRKLTPEDRHLLMQLFTGTANGIAERWFESEPMRNEMAAHCVSGNFTSLDAAGSAIPYFHHALGELEGKRGSWGAAKGGMGAITQAMAAFGRKYGVSYRCSAPVATVLLEKGRAVGVRLEDGEEIRARAILSNCDPKRTFLGFVGKENLPEGFAEDIARIRYGHATLRINLALSGTPRFAGVAEAEQALAQGSSVYRLPSRATIEENYRRAVAGELIDDPYMQFAMPSAFDETLAPPGHQVIHLIAKYYPYKLAGGKSWDEVGPQVFEGVLDRLEEILSGLRKLIVGRQFLSPLDLERVFGLTEGDIFHGRHDLDQVFSLRPHPASAGYRTPIDGLYLCGSGAHPGGGVSGAPGHNAARRAIKDLR